jgi:hypothetical protein
MAVAGVTTYAVAAGVAGGSGLHEDLMDLIVDISPTETPLFSSLAKSPVESTYTEWLQDTLSSATKENHAIEGADFSFSTAAVRTRVGAYTQIFTKQVEVTETERKVNVAGMDDEFNYQVEKAMKEIARDVEQAIVQGTANAGNSGAARRMKGILAFIATNINTGLSGGTSTTADEALTETHYNDLLQDIYDAGGNPDVTHVNGWQKRKIDSFSTNNTRYQDGSDGKLNSAVGVYQSSFGIQRIVLNRYMPTDQLMALEQARWKLGVLRPIAYTDVAKVADAKRGALVGELTLKGLNEAASGKIEDLTVA